jgi:predicted small lipoprotein YifL
MIMRLMIVVGLVLWLPACGTKSALDLPSGKPAPKGQSDPSMPPNPITR